MSDAVILEIVKTAGIIVTAILSTIGLIWGVRARKETKDLSVKVDGRLSELLEETKKRHEGDGFIKGMAQQKEETKQDLKDAPPIKLDIGKVKVEVDPPIILPPENDKGKAKGKEKPL